jgi:hypothetical protein
MWPQPNAGSFRAASLRQSAKLRDDPDTILVIKKALGSVSTRRQAQP